MELTVSNGFVWVPWTVSEKVQDKVKTAIENMTGLMVLEVNIKIAGVNMPAEA